MTQSTLFASKKFIYLFSFVCWQIRTSADKGAVSISSKKLCVLYHYWVKHLLTIKSQITFVTECRYFLMYQKGTFLFYDLIIFQSLERYDVNSMFVQTIYYTMYLVFTYEIDNLLLFEWSNNFWDTFRIDGT